MQSLFTTVRRLFDNTTTQTADAMPARADPATGPQLLAADELRLVSGGDGEPARLPVTKW